MAVGAGVFAVAQVEASEPAAAVAASTGQKLPAYNAFEFAYRSDFGKIILLEQNVETGQAVTQIPTEYHLQQYAASQRAQRAEQLQKLVQGGGGTGTGTGGTPVVKVAVSNEAGQAAPVQVASTPAPTAAPAAPAPAAPAAVASAPAAAVNITV